LLWQLRCFSIGEASKGCRTDDEECQDYGSQLYQDEKSKKNPGEDHPGLHKVDRVLQATLRANIQNFKDFI